MRNRGAALSWAPRADLTAAAHPPSRRAADGGEKIGAGRRVFADGPIAERTVVADRGSADEHRRRRRRLSDRFDEAARRQQPALENPILLRVAPAPRGDRFAREVDDRA